MNPKNLSAISFTKQGKPTTSQLDRKEEILTIVLDFKYCGAISPRASAPSGYSGTSGAEVGTPWIPLEWASAQHPHEEGGGKQPLLPRRPDNATGVAMSLYESVRDMPGKGSMWGSHSIQLQCTPVHVHISKVSLTFFVDVNAPHILITRPAKRQASSRSIAGLNKSKED